MRIIGFLLIAVAGYLAFIYEQTYNFFPLAVGGVFLVIGLGLFFLPKVVIRMVASIFESSAGTNTRVDEVDKVDELRNKLESGEISMFDFHEKRNRLLAELETRKADLLTEIQTLETERQDFRERMEAGEISLKIYDTNMAITRTALDDAQREMNSILRSISKGHQFRTPWDEAKEGEN